MPPPPWGKNKTKQLVPQFLFKNHKNTHAKKIRNPTKIVFPRFRPRWSSVGLASDEESLPTLMMRHEFGRGMHFS